MNDLERLKSIEARLCALVDGLPAVAKVAAPVMVAEVKQVQADLRCYIADQE